MSAPAGSLLASALQAKGLQIGAEAPGLAAILAAGSEDSLNPKLWVCEDSAAWQRGPEGTLALVADAHWGGSSSELLARHLGACWERASSLQNLERRLVKALLLLESCVQRDQAAGDRSETTALLAHVDGGTLRWANVGDSYLYLLAPGATPRLANRRDHAFLGNRPLAATSAWSSGSLPIPAGASVLLASDGLEPAASGLQPAEVGALLAESEPASPAGLERLAARALDPAQGGGRDNLALVWLDPQRALA